MHESGGEIMRRGHVEAEYYCGHYLTKKVHDLRNLQKRCNSDCLLMAGDDIPFATLEIAFKAGYSSCEHCIIEKSD